MTAVRHLRFLKVENFNFRSALEAQYASSCQISRRSVESFQWYGRFSIFKMVAVRHLLFSKVEILTSGPVRRPNVRHRAKFRKDRSNCSRDMADFQFFKMAAVRHLGFVLRVGTTHEEYLLVFVTVQNLVVIGAVISIYANFNILHVKLENACSCPQNRAFSGILPPKWEAVCTRPPKGTSLGGNTSHDV